MRYIFSILLFLVTYFSVAQTAYITNQEIWTGAFRQSYLDSYQPIEGDAYSLLNYNPETKSTSIDVYSYKSLKKTKTLIDSKDYSEIEYFDSYSFNASETHLLIATNTQSIYRHSSQAVYYIFEIGSKKLSKISEAWIQEPTFSNNNEQVAFIYNNNIYVNNLISNETKAITNDGVKNQIINGITDWVYEEEFGFVKAFEWSLDSKKIAYLKFNETDVPTFSMDVFGNQLYPQSYSFKYPKAGEKNADVSLHIANVTDGSSKKIAIGNYEYIPLLKWTNTNKNLVVATLNRHQNNLELISVDSENLNTKILLQEKDSCYISVEKISKLTFLKDNSFIWQSEKSGFNHLYHYSNTGKLKRQLTKGNWEVTKFYGIDAKQKKLYYQSTENGSINRTVYSIALNGRSKKIISKTTGTNDADFSKSKNYAIINHSDANTPLSYALFNGKKIIKEIKNNKQLIDKLAPYSLNKKEFSELKTESGVFNMWLLKPTNFDPNKTYPLVMVQYSGPGSQSVANSWNSYNDYWYHLLSQQGFVVACIDGRGTGYKGAAFKKATYKELGKLETIDQINAAKELGKYNYINAEKIAIWGWSYGGFMASNCILKGADVFDTAIAVAPVTSWRFYDSIYTERYMQTPQENPSGYDENSPLFHAEKLQGHYLLVHGTGDDNVHIQNTYQMSNVLIEQNKDFEQAIYPDRAHGIYRGRNTRIHLFTKMTNFLEQHLKN
ncbi:S9 family peptidase [Flavicella marina]|uniref:S9 family peptidase n=1 Tax=Flavicella marina TaxID=1475951 RepID=UPI001263E8AB|nr:S9 family peptidase [Flavicella marina]